MTPAYVEAHDPETAHAPVGHALDPIQSLSREPTNSCRLITRPCTMAGLQLLLP